MVSLWLSEFSALPDLYAQIQLPASWEKLCEPPLQLLQLEHFTLATMLLPLNPEPARSSICAPLLYWGML